MRPDAVYWQHGRPTENDFICVTAQTIGRDQLQRLSDEVGAGRTLLVICGALRVRDMSAFPNLTVKKVPKTVLSRCEWGRDDYGLEIKNLPMKAPETAPLDERKKESPRTKAERRGQRTLFDEEPEA